MTSPNNTLPSQQGQREGCLSSSLNAPRAQFAEDWMEGMCAYSNAEEHLKSLRSSEGDTSPATPEWPRPDVRKQAAEDAILRAARYFGLWVIFVCIFALVVAFAVGLVT